MFYDRFRPKAAVNQERDVQSVHSAAHFRVKPCQGSRSSGRVCDCVQPRHDPAFSLAGTIDARNLSTYIRSCHFPRPLRSQHCCNAGMC